MALIPVILSGGSGTRLWPLSRELLPKQLLPMVGEQTLLQETAARPDGLPDVQAPIVVCSEHHRFAVAEQLRLAGRPAATLLLEPVGRNTAPAVALAALSAIAGAPAGTRPLLLVMPADHVVQDLAAFRSAVTAGIAAARRGALVTFGIVPTRPETGYGYIRHRAGDGPTFEIAAFVEKPDAEHAAAYVASGQYLWNSGLFLFEAQAYLEELERQQPAMAAACARAHAAATRDLDFTRVDAAAFAACPADSIDYAVMEKTARGVVVPMAAGWSDIGSWDALHDAHDADAAGNVAHGDVLMEDCAGTYVHAGSRLVAAVGLVDHVVVETADAVLVVPRQRAQDVKRVVERLKATGRPEALQHREVFRPWGSYDSVDTGERFQVKRLVVKPGASMSLQLHHHRAEHWIVVQGTAQITRGDETLLLGENESTYIALGMKHRIANPGKVPLHIIEVQTGSYLGEDDIVRFEDVYGR